MKHVDIDAESGAEQISVVNAVSHDVNQTAFEVSSQAGELSSLSAELKQIIDRFILDDP